MFRHLRFFDGTVPNSGENPEFFHGWGGDETRYRILMQEIEFGSYPARYATTLFDAGDSNFENSQVRLIGSDDGMDDEDNSHYHVYRENYFEDAAEFATSIGVRISAQHGSSKMPILEWH